jgi:hypothetical protein
MNAIEDVEVIEPEAITKATVKLTYNEIHKLAEYGRMKHGWITYPVQLACKKLVDKGITGRLEIYPNEYSDGLPDVVYSSILHAANNANAHYRQKGKDYCAYYPIADKRRKLTQC